MYAKVSGATSSDGFLVQKTRRLDSCRSDAISRPGLGPTFQLWSNEPVNIWLKSIILTVTIAPYATQRFFYIQIAEIL